MENISEIKNLSELNKNLSEIEIVTEINEK